MKRISLAVSAAVVSLTAMTSSPALAVAVNVQFINQGTSVPYHGVYAGYYNVKVDGVNTLALCDDFLTGISYGQSWTANEFTYADVAGGASTKFLDTQKYSQAGWLFGQTAAVTPLVRAQMQGAIWNIMSPGSVVMDPLAQGFYNQATSGAYDTYDWGGVMKVLTPTPFMSGQEFLTPVPEPSPALLFGSGLAVLMGVVGISRRKA